MSRRISRIARRSSSERWAYLDDRSLPESTSHRRAYTAFLAVGTGEPWLEGCGSLQLPILYAGLALLQVPLMREPFVNPVTAKSVDPEPAAGE